MFVSNVCSVAHTLSHHTSGVIHVDNWPAIRNMCITCFNPLRRLICFQSKQSLSRSSFYKLHTPQRRADILAGFIYILLIESRRWRQLNGSRCLRRVTNRGAKIPLDAAHWVLTIHHPPSSPPTGRVENQSNQGCYRPRKSLYIKLF